MKPQEMLMTFCTLSLPFVYYNYIRPKIQLTDRNLTTRDVRTNDLAYGFENDKQKDETDSSKL